MKLKQIISILAVCTILFIFCACGESTASNAISSVPSEEQITGLEETFKHLESEPTDSSQKKTDEKDEAEFEKITVIDNEDCTIEITGIDPDNIFGYTLKAFIENKSEDTTYMVSVDTAAINGVMCDPFFATEVSAGKKANSEINFSTSELEENGICDFSDIEITFHVYNSEDWLADDITLETVHIYPYGESSATSFVRESQPADIVLIENDKVSFIMTDVVEDDIWGYTVNLYLENKTNTTVMFSVDDVSVNGYMLDPFFASSVDPGKCKFTSMSWPDSSLEENGIEAVTEIELTIRAYNDDDWAADLFAEETVTINP